jgi:polyhydroxybutyrate depolymerase
LLKIDGVERSYILYVPPKPARPAPLIFVFHGGGSTAEIMTRLDVDEKAGDLGFVVVFPQGYGNSWNAGPGADNRSPNWGPAFEEGIDDVAFVKAILTDVSQVVKIDPRRIYATGWSNGSAMSSRLAVELCDTIAAVAGAASEISLFNPQPPKRPVPVIYFWGTADPIQRPGVPDAKGRAAQHLATWIRLNHASQEGKVIKRVGKAECVLYKGEQGGADVVVWTIEGMGHQWPGIVPQPEMIQALGPASTDISATEEMLEFFLKHPMP